MQNQIIAILVFISFTVVFSPIYLLRRKMWLMADDDLKKIDYEDWSKQIKFNAFIKLISRLIWGLFLLSEFIFNFQKNVSRPKYKERFVVKARGNIRFVETVQIAFFQMQDGILFAFDAAGEKFPLNENLNNLEQLLDPQMFFRINRSEIVNFKFIERLEPYFNDRLVVRLRNLKIKLVSSANRTPGLRKWLEGYN